MVWAMPCLASSLPWLWTSSSKYWGEMSTTYLGIGCKWPFVYIHHFNVQQAVKQMHLPSSEADLDEARRRLAFDDLFFPQLMMLLRRSLIRSGESCSKPIYLVCCLLALLLNLAFRSVKHHAIMSKPSHQHMQQHLHRQSSWLHISAFSTFSGAMTTFSWFAWWLHRGNI